MFMFIAVRSFDNYIPANMMLQRLEEEGIKAYLQDEHTVTIDPILTNALGGIKLMVYEEQSQRALELIESFESSYKKAAACPNCGSENVQYITQQKNVTNWLSAILTWMFGSYAIGIKQVYHCYNCGFEFENLPD
jgi:DNA-directed RNA polymerase subunit RPC12/RpoP